jgi:hypothetical protein
MREHVTVAPRGKQGPKRFAIAVHNAASIHEKCGNAWRVAIAGPSAQRDGTGGWLCDDDHPEHVGRARRKAGREALQHFSQWLVSGDDDHQGA